MDGSAHSIIYDSQQSSYGRSEGDTMWLAGDVLGCALDKENYSIEFFLNGRPLGVAFSITSHSSAPWHDDLYPALSFREEASFRINLGSQPFRYLPDGCIGITSGLERDLQNTGVVEMFAHQKWLPFKVSLHPKNVVYDEKPTEMNEKKDDEEEKEQHNHVRYVEDSEDFGSCQASLVNKAWVDCRMHGAAGAGSIRMSEALMWLLFSDTVAQDDMFFRSNLHFRSHRPYEAHFSWTEYISRPGANSLKIIFNKPACSLKHGSDSLKFYSDSSMTQLLHEFKGRQFPDKVIVPLDRVFVCFNSGGDVAPTNGWEFSIEPTFCTKSSAQRWQDVPQETLARLISVLLSTCHPKNLNVDGKGTTENSNSPTPVMFEYAAGIMCSLAQVDEAVSIISQNDAIDLIRAILALEMNAPQVERARLSALRCLTMLDPMLSGLTRPEMLLSLSQLSSFTAHGAAGIATLALHTAMEAQLRQERLDQSFGQNTSTDQSTDLIDRHKHLKKLSDALAAQFSDWPVVGVPKKVNEQEPSPNTNENVDPNAEEEKEGKDENVASAMENGSDSVSPKDDQLKKMLDQAPEVHSPVLPILYFLAKALQNGHHSLRCSLEKCLLEGELQKPKLCIHEEHIDLVLQRINDIIQIEQWSSNAGIATLLEALLDPKRSTAVMRNKTLTFLTSLLDQVKGIIEKSDILTNTGQLCIALQVVHIFLSQNDLKGHDTQATQIFTCSALARSILKQAAVPISRLDIPNQDWRNKIVLFEKPTATGIVYVPQKAAVLSDKKTDTEPGEDGEEKTELDQSTSNEDHFSASIQEATEEDQTRIRNAGRIVRVVDINKDCVMAVVVHWPSRSQVREFGDFGVHIFDPRGLTGNLVHFEKRIRELDYDSPELTDEKIEELLSSVGNHQQWFPSARVVRQGAQLLAIWAEQGEKGREVLVRALMTDHLGEGFQILVSLLDTASDGPTLRFINDCLFSLSMAEGGMQHILSFVRALQDSGGSQHARRWLAQVLALLSSPPGVLDDLVITVESPHPYYCNSDTTKRVNIPMSRELYVQFDPQCNTESCDVLRITGPDNQSFQFSGGPGPNWNAISVKGDWIQLRFTSDSSVQHWGYSAKIHPKFAEMNESTAPSILSSLLQNDGLNLILEMIRSDDQDIVRWSIMTLVNCFFANPRLRSDAKVIEKGRGPLLKIAQSIMSDGGDIVQFYPSLFVENSGFPTMRLPDLHIMPIGEWKPRVYYEFIPAPAGIMQMGWAPADHAPSGSGNGVGDDQVSYGFDGKRVSRWWGGSSESYGKLWSTSDVIGCGVDFAKGEIRFWFNGEDMGLAFTKEIHRPTSVPEETAWSGGFMPSGSYSSNTGATFHFKPSEVKHLPSGWMNLMDAVAEMRRLQGSQQVLQPNQWKWERFNFTTRQYDPLNTDDPMVRKIEMDSESKADTSFILAQVSRSLTAVPLVGDALSLALSLCSSDRDKRVRKWALRALLTQIDNSVDVEVKKEIIETIIAGTTEEAIDFAAVLQSFAQSMDSLMRTSDEYLSLKPMIDPKDAEVLENINGIIVESDHPYENRTNKEYDIFLPNASFMQVTFDPMTKTESSYDYVVFLNEQGKEISTKFSGGREGSSRNFPGLDSREPLTIPSNKAKIKFVSDDSNVVSLFIYAKKELCKTMCCG